MDTKIENSSEKTSIWVWVGIALGVYAVLLSVGLVGGGFKWASGGKEGAERLFAFATNPFLGLLIGTLATALVQSSSTVTSVIVGLVAGGLPVATAIPMIMGANIGTTITNTIVSLGHIRNKVEFQRAFSAATMHDFFNLLAVAIFLPLELATGFLARTGEFLVSVLYSGAVTGSTGGFNVIKAMTKPVVGAMKSSLAALPEPFGGVLMVLIGIALIFFAITFVGRLLRKAMVGRAKKILHTAIGRGPITGIFSGTAVTVLVQSSSTTTSLAIPLAGSGVFSAKQIYPFTLGSNIGTCITALVAALGVSGGNAQFAMQIALIHLIFNVSGVLLIYGLPLFRELPVIWSDKLAHLACERKALALSYVVGVFFVVPGIATYITSAM